MNCDILTSKGKQTNDFRVLEFIIIKLETATDRFSKTSLVLKGETPNQEQRSLRRYRCCERAVQDEL
jgi:hypothetical protein